MDDNVPEGFKMAEIGILPEDWELRHMDDIVTRKNGLKRGPWGGSIKKEIFVPEGYKVYEQRNVIANDFRIGSYFITEEKFGELIDFEVRPGDILVTAAGTLGKISIVPEVIEQGIINQALLRIRLDDEKICDIYFKFLFTNLVDNRLLDRYSHGATLKNLSSVRVLRSIGIPLPPLPEQRNIAAVLSAVQETKEKTEGVIEAARELKKSLMKHLFTYGPVSPGDADKVPLKETEIGLMPEHWGSRILSDLCLETVDCPHSSPHYLDSGVLVVRNFNIRDGRLSLHDAYYTTEEEYLDRVRRCVPQEGDVLFSREAPIGEACLVPPHTKLSMGQRIMLLRTDPSKLNNHFLVLIFYSGNIKSLMLSLASGVTAKHLNVGDVRRLEIPLPPLHEQQEITSIVSAVDRKIEAEENRRQALEELFRTLLNNLMTGRIRVNNLDIEPTGR